MSQNTATRLVSITNSEGLHLRAARSVADTVRRFESQVCLIKDGERVEATEVLQMLSLGVAEGEQLSLEAAGRDAEQVIEALAELFAENFAMHEEDTKKEEATDNRP